MSYFLLLFRLFNYEFSHFNHHAIEFNAVTSTQFMVQGHTPQLKSIQTREWVASRMLVNLFNKIIVSSMMLTNLST